MSEKDISIKNISNPASILSLKDVCVSYDKLRTIHSVSFDVKKGEIFGLMGLNGAGKTTIIKTILGLRAEDSGDILINGLNKASGVAKQNLSYLPEKFEPPWFLTGIEFLKFARALYKKPFDRAAMVAASESLALEGSALNNKVQTYSKGMRQKLGLLGTLMTDCSLYILDEPMSGLDPMARALVKNMITDMKEQGKTVFLSSHILADMDEICDRVGLLHKGDLTFIGTPAELKATTNMDNLERAFLDYIERKAVA